MAGAAHGRSVVRRRMRAGYRGDPGGSTASRSAIRMTPTYRPGVTSPAPIRSRIQWANWSGKAKTMNISAQPFAQPTDDLIVMPMPSPQSRCTATSATTPNATRPACHDRCHATAPTAS